MQDQLVAAYARMVPHNSALGAQIVAIEDGGVVHARLPFREEFLGDPQAGLWHTSAAISRSIDFGVDYLRSAKARKTYAACQVIRHGRRVAQVRAQAWQTDRTQPVALARIGFLLQDACLRDTASSVGP